MQTKDTYRLPFLDGTGESNPGRSPDTSTDHEMLAAGLHMPLVPPSTTTPENHPPYDPRPHLNRLGMAPWHDYYFTPNMGVV